ncbi:MAG: YjgN family protein [Paracraurococcus sp.]
MSASATSPPLSPLAYHGRPGDLIGLSLKNLLLNIVTLGFWRFWGRTRVRRVIWGETALLGDRLEYTGRGKELFRGFVIAAVLLTVLVLAEQAIAYLLMPGTFGVIWLPTVALLVPIGLQLARRYLASRTVWRGIRFTHAGSPGGYLWLQIRWWLLVTVTLGLAWPWKAAAETRWAIGKLQLGSETFAFDGTGRQLVGRFLIAAAMNIGLMGLILGCLAAAGVFPSFDLIQSEALLRIWLSLLAYGFLALVFFGPVTWWFRAAYLRWRAEHTTLAGARFAMPGATFWAIARLSVGNLLILVFSLGVLWPVIQARTVAFQARHMRCDRLPGLDDAQQGAPGPRTGEGLSGLLAVDALGA